jgi:FtsP/CotA-like multicopper oxidase with cupredoxin domain
MSRLGFQAAAALLLLVCGMPLSAQEPAPQPFFAPPRLPEKIQPGAKLLTAPPVTTGCKPDGDISHDGNLVTLHLVAEVAPNQINNPSHQSGTKDNVKLRSYGGCLTGPAIEVKPGNTLRIFLDNSLDVKDPSCPADGHAGPGCFNTINMHFHGLHVSPTGNSDNVLLNIGPHTKFEYEVNIPADHPSGTFWYHPHRHGSTALQVASGASGALIIRGDRHYVGGAPGDIDTILHDAAGKPMPEQIFLFQQIPYACFDAAGKIIENPDQTWQCPAGQTGVVEDFDQQLASPTVWDTSGRFTSINGAVQPTITGIGAGQVQRWRFIHAGIHDTVNLQIVPMVTTGPKAALALRGLLTGTPKEQEETVKQLCPVTIPDGSKPVNLVPQFEIATDGLTRPAIVPIGVNQKNISGGIGSNFLQPGYRSDLLVVFPHAGTYCMLNQAATPAERTNAGGGGQGPNQTQLLATVIVFGGKPVTGDLGEFIRTTLYDGNKSDRTLPKAALDGLRRGDLSPWRGMPEEGPASNSSNPRTATFYIGKLPDPAHPHDPPGPFGFWLNQKEYDPDRVDLNLQVGNTEDWVLTSFGEPHIYHIHVNPFEVMDVTHDGKSIFGPNGECLVPPDSVGLQNQYCNMWHTFKDTVFVQNDYEVHVRSNYDRYIGEFVMHCHILDHEDSGMMANVLIVPDLMAKGGGLGMPGMKTISNGTMTQKLHQQ